MELYTQMGQVIIISLISQQTETNFNKAVKFKKEKKNQVICSRPIYQIVTWQASTWHTESKILKL